MIDVGRGAIENILIAQDEERSRMVINLISAVGFVSEAADNRLTWSWIRSSRFRETGGYGHVRGSDGAIGPGFHPDRVD